MGWATWQTRETMPHHEDRFRGHDGLELYEQYWLPQDGGAAAVVLVHGFIEHSGRYARVAAELNTEGYAVYAMDLRGHGRSAGDRAWVRSFEQYVADLGVFLQRVRRDAPQQPLFLFGHSMGGAIVAQFALEQRPDVCGLVLSAPAVSVGKNVFPVLRRAASLVSRLLPRLRLVRFGSRYLSRDPRVVAHFESDPLVFHGRFPVRTGAEILAAAERIQRHSGERRLPMLILQGTADRAVDPEGNREFYERSASTDKTLRLYEGLYHEPLSEPERDQVVADLIEWLNRRCQSARDSH